MKLSFTEYEYRYKVMSTQADNVLKEIEDHLAQCQELNAKRERILDAIKVMSFEQFVERKPLESNQRNHL